MGGSNGFVNVGEGYLSCLHGFLQVILHGIEYTWGALRDKMYAAILAELIFLYLYLRIWSVFFCSCA